MKRSTHLFQTGCLRETIIIVDCEGLFILTAWIVLGFLVARVLQRGIRNVRRLSELHIWTHAAENCQQLEQKP